VSSRSRPEGEKKPAEGDEHERARTQTSTRGPTDRVQAASGRGTLWAWGQGTNGELGNGTDKNSFSRPVKVKFPAGVKIALIASDAMPYDSAIAVDTQGRACGWGLNKHGELCLGTQTGYDLPHQLPLNHVTALAGANGHAAGP
jgi:alpha-tubulin suppressor-like RCC1 family protein